MAFIIVLVVLVSKMSTNYYNSGFFYFGHSIAFPIGMYVMDGIEKKSKKYIYALSLLSLSLILGVSFFSEFSLFIGDLVKIIFAYLLGLVLCFAHRIIPRYPVLGYFGRFSLEIYILHMSFYSLFTIICHIESLYSIVISIIISVVTAPLVSLCYKRIVNKMKVNL